MPYCSTLVCQCILTTLVFSYIWMATLSDAWVPSCTVMLFCYFKFRALQHHTTMFQDCVKSMSGLICLFASSFSHSAKLSINKNIVCVFTLCQKYKGCLSRFVILLPGHVTRQVVCEMCGPNSNNFNVSPQSDNIGEYQSLFESHCRKKFIEFQHCIENCHKVIYQKRETY